MSLICPDYATAEDIAAHLANPRVFMLRQSDVPGLDLYFTVTALDLANVDPGAPHWQLGVGFAEVTWPNGGYVPVAVWTYADLAAAYPDYNAVATAFVDYLAVLEHRPTP